MEENRDMFTRILDYEGGEALTFAEYVDLFQDLIDTGFAWTLQGYYGRTAQSLIDQGVCSRNGRKCLDK